MRGIRQTRNLALCVLVLIVIGSAVRTSLSVYTQNLRGGPVGQRQVYAGFSQRMESLLSRVVKGATEKVEEDGLDWTSSDSGSSPDAAMEAEEETGMRPVEVGTEDTDGYSAYRKNKRLWDMCEKTFFQTVRTTVSVNKKSEYFVFTGDIHDMWIRDSAGQVHPYVEFVKENKELYRLVEGTVLAQAKYIQAHPYANSYKENYRTRVSKQDERLGRGRWIATNNYEMDSGSYFFKLTYEFWKATGKLLPVSKAVMTMLETWKVEQHHEERSKYRYIELTRNGLGTPTGYTGMSWTGFRPSDDRCRYHYHIPDNMFAVVALGYVLEMANTWKNEAIRDLASQLRQDIRDGLAKYATTNHRRFGKVYCYEVDGLGGCNIMDDANVPSLLSIPYLDPEGISYDKEIYANTKRMILSRANPFYFSGSQAKGIGSPHTFPGRVWHMALIMQARLANPTEQQELVQTILSTTDGTMHESFDVNNYKRYSRAWFAWADALFAEGPWCKPFRDHLHKKYRLGEAVTQASLR